MGNETSKARPRRLASGYYEQYFQGKGKDIGCGPDPLTPDCDRWDKEQGDAETLVGVPDAYYDWVYSSHCLEHLHDPKAATTRWWQVLKPGGYLLVVVPMKIFMNKVLGQVALMVITNGHLRSTKTLVGRHEV